MLSLNWICFMWVGDVKRCLSFPWRKRIYITQIVLLMSESYYQIVNIQKYKSNRTTVYKLG